MYTQDEEYTCRSARHSRHIQWHPSPSAWRVTGACKSSLSRRFRFVRLSPALLPRQFAPVALIRCSCRRFICPRELSDSGWINLRGSVYRRRFRVIWSFVAYVVIRLWYVWIVRVDILSRCGKARKFFVVYHFPMYFLNTCGSERLVQTEFIFVFYCSVVMVAFLLPYNHLNQ